MELPPGTETGLQRRPRQARTHLNASGNMTDTNDPRRWNARRAAGWIGLLLLGFALAFWLRYGVIQPTDIGITCGQADAPGWCAPRQWLISAQHYRIWGWVGLVGGLVDLVIAVTPGSVISRRPTFTRSPAPGRRLFLIMRNPAVRPTPSKSGISPLECLDRPVFPKYPNRRSVPR